jgi:hypothetical protein
LSLLPLKDLTRRLLNSSDCASRRKQTSDDFNQVEIVITEWSRQNYVPGNVRPAVYQEQLVRRVVEEKIAANPLAWIVNM